MITIAIATDFVPLISEATWCCNNLTVLPNHSQIIVFKLTDFLSSTLKMSRISEPLAVAVTWWEPQILQIGKFFVLKMICIKNIPLLDDIHILFEMFLVDKLVYLSHKLFWLFQNFNSILIGASLSEPHTSVTALCTCVCMYVCLFAAIYRKF